MTREEALLEIAADEFGLESLTPKVDWNARVFSIKELSRALELAYERGRESATSPMTTESSPSNPTNGYEPELIAVAHHRNGVRGAPFNVVLFNDVGRFPGNKLGIVFEAEDHVVVFDFAKLAAGDIAFGSNSWRGDLYEKRLRSMIVAWSQESDGNDE